MSKKKVLVIGGTGIAGQFITDYLLHYRKYSANYRY